MTRARLPGALLVLAALAAASASAATWAEEKCARYAAAWAALEARRGTDDLGAAFVARHEAFIASGCAARADICPQGDAEYEVANAMIVAAMNAGAASTFPPFACPRR